MMEGINAGYNLYIECQKCDGGRPSILPSLSVEQYENFVLSASQVRQSRLEYIIDYPNQRYNTLVLCELAALCPFYRPPALEHIQETPHDLALWLEAIRNGNLDRMTYATLFRLLHLLLSESESYKNILKVLDVQMSILQCYIGRFNFTLPLLATTHMFTQHLMDIDSWHPMIGKLKMIYSQFSTMVPSLEEFEKSCVILHDVQNNMPLCNRRLPGSLSTAAEVFDLEIPTYQLQAARNVLVWMETHIDWFHHLRPSLVIPTDLAEFRRYLATPHARIRTQYILQRLSDSERFNPGQWLLLLHTLAALCPLRFPAVRTRGDLIPFLHAFHTTEMTPTSFKVLYQILSITTFPSVPPVLAKDIQIIQKRLQWTTEDFEESLASAISYFQGMFPRKSVEFQGHINGMKAILAVKRQVKTVEPLTSIATLLRGLKYLQQYQIKNSSKGQELFSISLGTRFVFRPTRESISDNCSVSYKECLSVLPSPKSVTTRVESCDQMHTMAEQSTYESTVDTDCRPFVLISTVDLPINPTRYDMASKVFPLNETQEPESRQKKHECDVCGHNFQRIYDLRRHYRSHTSEKTHKCDCGRAFARSDALKRHKKVHEKKDLDRTPSPISLPSVWLNQEGSRAMVPCTVDLISGSRSQAEKRKASDNAFRRRHSWQKDKAALK